MSKNSEQSSAGTVTVSGVGEVQVKPDVAWIRLGVLTNAKTARDASADNATRMSALIERMKQLGIPEKKLQTGGLSVSPVFQYAEVPEKGQIIGYNAENYLTVRCPVDSAGSIFDEGMAAGATQSSSMSFGLQDDSEHADAALEEAVKAARHKAKVVAAALGVRLGGPLSVEVGQGGRIGPQRELAMAKEAATPVLPGAVTVSAQVTIVFAC